MWLAVDTLSFRFTRRCEPDVENTLVGPFQSAHNFIVSRSACIPKAVAYNCAVKITLHVLGQNLG